MHYGDLEKFQRDKSMFITTYLSLASNILTEKDVAIALHSNILNDYQPLNIKRLLQSPLL